jgi:AcrR family transcriptional regulator
MPKSPREDAATTKERIVAAALDTIRTHGVAGASARAIGRAGGFNQALIFYHFGSLDDMFLAACDELSAKRVAAYTERIEGITSLRELVAVAAELHREDTQEGHITVLSQLLAGATTNPQLRAPLRERFEPWTAIVQTAIERVVAGTPYASVVPAADLAFVVTSLFMGMELTMSLEDDPARAEGLFRTIDLMATLLEALLAGQPAGDQASQRIEPR